MGLDFGLHNEPDPTVVVGHYVSIAYNKAYVFFRLLVRTKRTRDEIM